MKNEKVDINEIVKYLYSDSTHKILIEQLIDAGIIFSVYGSTLRAGVEVATRGDTATTPRDLDVFIGVSTLDHVPGRIVDIEKEFKLGGYVFNYVAKYPSYIKDEKGSADKFETYEYTVNGKLIHLVFGTTLPTNVETLDADVNCLYLCKVGCTPGWTLRSSAGYDLDKVVENIKNKTFILGKTSFSSRTKKLLEAGYKQLVKVDLPEDVVDEIVQISRTYSYNFTPISNPLTEEALVKFKEEYKEFASIEPSAISFRSAPFLKKMSGQIHWGNVSLPGDMFAELWNYPQDIGAAFFAHATSPATRTKFYSQLRDTLHKLKESAIDSIINSLNPCYFNDQEFLTIFLPQLSTQQLRALVGKPGFNINTILNLNVLNNKKVIDKLVSADFKFTDVQTKWMLTLYRTFTAGSPINFPIPKEMEPEPEEKDEMDDSVTIDMDDNVTIDSGYYIDNNRNTCYVAKHNINGSIIYTEVKYYKNEDGKIVAVLRRGSKSSLGIASRYNTYKETDHITDFTETEIVLYEVDKPIPMIEHFSPSAKVFDILDISILHWRYSSYDNALCAPTCSKQSNDNLHDFLKANGFESITVSDLIGNDFVAKKTEEPKMSEETKAAETTETKTERPDFFTLAKRDLNEAQYRMIRSQLLDAAKSVFLAILAKDESNSPHLESVKKVLESKGGEAFLSGALGYGLTFTPGDFMQDARIQTMAEEFRVNGMHKAEEQIFDIVMDAITPTIMQTLNNSLASLPVLEEASAPPVVAKKNIQREAEIEAQAEAEMEAEEEAALSGQRSSIAP